jgi:hypothetical protein
MRTAWCHRLRKRFGKTFLQSRPRRWGRQGCRRHSWLAVEPRRRAGHRAHARSNAEAARCRGAAPGTAACAGSRLRTCGRRGTSGGERRRGVAGQLPYAETLPRGAPGRRTCAPDAGDRSRRRPGSATIRARYARARPSGHADRCAPHRFGEPEVGTGPVRVPPRLPAQPDAVCHQPRSDDGVRGHRPDEAGRRSVCQFHHETRCRLAPAGDDPPEPFTGDDDDTASR